MQFVKFFEDIGKNRIESLLLEKESFLVYLGASCFMHRRGTTCMLPRSRADETVGRVTFRRKTQWFQHTLPLSPESGPGGSRDAPDAFRGLLGVPPWLSRSVPKAPSGILLTGFLI